MAIKMVREPSDTPNINNIDDFVGLRYSYGNQNGYVKGKGSEIGYEVNGSIFKIKSGRIVLQGVECDIDANGVEIVIDNIATQRYHSIYLQVNLATMSVSILEQHDTASYPSISAGDDLNEDTTGIARLVLYHFTSLNGEISNVSKLLPEIVYSGTALKDYDINKGTIEERLTALGFKSGNFGISGGTITANTITRQGNYVIGKLTISDIEIIGERHDTTVDSYVECYWTWNFPISSNKFYSLNSVRLTANIKCGFYTSMTSSQFNEINYTAKIENNELIIESNQMVYTPGFTDPGNGVVKKIDVVFGYEADPIE